ncbi:MAG: tRNA-modifying protein YgfZ [Buchnera aphidicola (Melaphis rhois)]
MTILQYISNYPSYFFKEDIILMELNDWILTTITGSDSKNYLQNKITININSINKNNHMLCAHCNINGKVWSNLRLFRLNETSYMYLQRKSISNKQVQEFKKYSIFSNITICNKADLCLLGITGTSVKKRLSQYFKKLPNKNLPVYYQNEIILLWFSDPFERFLLISEKNNIVLKKILKLTKIIHDSNLWLALDISCKYPIIDKEMSGKFLPQSLNLENLNGLDFKKGCYYGQEMVSKAQFKKLNKYNLYWLIGESNRIVHIGERIEIEDNKEWRKVGYILAVSRINETTIWIQAILRKNITVNNIIRIENDLNNNLYVQT